MRKGFGEFVPDANPDYQPAYDTTDQPWPWSMNQRKLVQPILPIVYSILYTPNAYFSTKIIIIQYKTENTVVTKKITKIQAHLELLIPVFLAELTPELT